MSAEKIITKASNKIWNEKDMMQDGFQPTICAKTKGTSELVLYVYESSVSCWVHGQRMASGPCVPDSPLHVCRKFPTFYTHRYTVTYVHTHNVIQIYKTKGHSSYVRIILSVTNVPVPLTGNEANLKNIMMVFLRRLNAHSESYQATFVSL